MSESDGKDCFGKWWDEKSPECAGGLDPLYTHPITGSKVHPRCDLYDECKKKTCGEVLVGLNRRPTIQVPAPPPITYTIPSAPIKPVITPTPALQQYAGRYITQAPIQQPQLRPYPSAQPQYPQYQTTYQQPQQQQQQQQTPQFFPAVFHPTLQLQPYESPPFLTVLEPVIPGESPLKRMLFEALRAAAKGMLHHTTFVVDHMPLSMEPDK